MKRLTELIVLAPVATLALPVLIDSAFKGVLLMGAILIALRLLRKSSAALRHLVLLSAMAMLLALPVLSLSLPGWRVLPAWAEIQPLEPSPAPTAATGSGRVVVFARDHAAPPAAVSQPPGATPIVTSESRSTSWISLAVWIWSLGAVFFSLRLSLCQWSLWRLGRKSIPIDGSALAATAEDLKEAMGIRRKVQVLVHPGRTMPMTWGILKTRLLLPEAALHWEASRLRSVLLHELAHIKRLDSQTQLLVQLTCMIHWFNPLAWITARRIASERERACDDLVLNSGIRASEYAEHLLRIATGYENRATTNISAVAMASRCRLGDRVANILNKDIDRRSITRRVGLGILCALVVLALPVAMMRAVGQENTIEKKDDPDKVQASVVDVRPEWNVVAINIGADRAVAVGMRINVQRNGIFIGELEVTSTAAGFSLCDVIGDTIPLKGDRIFMKKTLTRKENAGELKPNDLGQPEDLTRDLRIWSEEAGASLDEVIRAETYGPPQITFTDRTAASSQSWFTEPTDLVEDKRSETLTGRRYEFDEMSAPQEGGGTAADPLPKTGGPIFKRSFLGGSKNLRGYDFRNANAKPVRKFFQAPDGKILYVDFGPSKISDSFFDEDFTVEKERVDPQPDSLINLTKSLDDGSFSLRKRLPTSSFYRNDLPLELDPPGVKEAPAALDP